MEGPLVTVGVPVYRGQDWVATTLECLRTQSYSKLDVLISIDGPDPASLAACRPFLADGRFRPEAQPSRRGWAENINWTMSRRRGEFFIFQQQDDQVSPTYIADLVAAAARCPKAAICYSKMEVSGIESGMVRHKPLLGHPAKRVLTYLERMDTSMFLGLIRSAAIAATSGLPTNAFDSFGAELPFMAELARVGEFRFVEGPTYFKRLHGRNTHLQWYAWPEDRKRAAWLRLAVAMVDAVVPAGKSLTERPQQRRPRLAPNLGIRIAEGDWVAYLGHDDIWSPHHLEALHDLIRKEPTTGFAVGGCIYYGPPGSEVYWVTGLFEQDGAKFEHFFPPSSLAHRRELADRIGGWRPPRSTPAPVDCDFLLRAAHAGVRFSSTGQVTTHKFAAGHRYLSYLRPESSEQWAALRDPSLDDPDRLRPIVESSRRQGRFMRMIYPDFSQFEQGAFMPPTGQTKALRDRR